MKACSTCLFLEDFLLMIPNSIMAQDEAPGALQALHAM